MWNLLCYFSIFKGLVQNSVMVSSNQLCGFFSFMSVQNCLALMMLLHQSFLYVVIVNRFTIGLWAGIGELQKGWGWKGPMQTACCISCAQSRILRPMSSSLDLFPKMQTPQLLWAVSSSRWSTGSWLGWLQGLIPWDSSKPGPEKAESCDIWGWFLPLWTIYCSSLVVGSFLTQNANHFFLQISLASFFREPEWVWKKSSLF